MSAEDYGVSVTVHGDEQPLEEIVAKYERGVRLSKEEAEVLVEYPRTGVDVAEWRRLRAKVMWGGNPHTEGDKAAEQAAVEWLREILEEHGVETVDGYDDLLEQVGDDHEIQEALKEITNNATPFDHKPSSNLKSLLSLDSDPDERLESLLEDSDADPIEESYRPEDAGDGWDPSVDQELHEFIAHTEKVSESDVFEDMLRFDELKEAADFDPEEWDLDDNEPNTGGV